MQADDVYRRAFVSTTARLTAWAEQLRDVADVEHEQVGDFWRLRLVPFASQACPAEVILHQATQTYDVQIGAESFEGLRVKALADFLPVLAAITGGHVVTRAFHSIASNALLRVETTIHGPDGPAMRLDRPTALGLRFPAADAAIRARHWLPYRRH